MAITEEKSLMTSEKFNRGVENWTWKVRNTSVNILQRTHATGRLRRELQSRWLKDREGGPAYVGLGFRFARYGAYREYGAGRGYIVKNGIIMKGHSAWSDKKKRQELRSLRVSEYRIRRMRTVDEHYAVIRRSPLPWLDPPIVDNIESLADLSGEYYGDQALKNVLQKFDKITIEKRYGKSDKTVKRGVYLYIDGKEIKNDINSIDLEMKRLQRDIKEMTRGSEEYNRTMAKIQHLQGILKQHRQEIKGITTETKKATVSIGSMVDWFNRFGGVILSVIGFLTGFTLALRAIRDERNKLEESQAGLKALTGLDDDSIAWLTGQAKTLSTTMTKEGLRVRQSAAEILDAFMLVGSAKPELLGDKEALKAVTEEAMRLQAAAKDITLNEAVDSLTLSLNQYGAAADQAGRFTNVLAAGSQAGSANIASQAKAIRNAGTAAASANVPIEQTVALIETLAYRGIKDEVAGTGLKKFFLVLQTGADETNPKIVGLDKALENLKNKNMDAGAIKKMFGEEGYNTASVILQNTEMVKDFTAAVTGTNVAYEQAAINSDTAQAKLEQARNKMKLAAIDLGEKLNPALTVSTNMLTNVLKYLPGLIDWCKNGVVLYCGLVRYCLYMLPG